MGCTEFCRRHHWSNASKRLCDATVRLQTWALYVITDVIARSLLQYVAAAFTFRNVTVLLMKMCGTIRRTWSAIVYVPFMPSFIRHKIALDRNRNNTRKAQNCSYNDVTTLSLLTADVSQATCSYSHQSFCLSHSSYSRYMLYRRFKCLRAYLYLYRRCQHSMRRVFM